MVEGALNAAAELVLEKTAYGNARARRQPSPERRAAGSVRLRRLGAVAGDLDRDRRAVAGVARRARRSAVGPRPVLSTIAGRRAAQDDLDAHLGEWARDRDVAEAARLLIDHGVPAAAGVDPRLTTNHPHLVARGFYEVVDHAVVGAKPMPTLPFRFASVDRWLLAPAPMLGEHNEAVLCGLLGLSRAEFDQLIVDGIIGDRPKGL